MEIVGIGCSALLGLIATGVLTSDQIITSGARFPPPRTSTQLPQPKRDPRQRSLPYQHLCSLATPGGAQEAAADTVATACPTGPRNGRLQ